MEEDLQLQGDSLVSVKGSEKSSSRGSSTKRRSLSLEGTPKEWRAMSFESIVSAENESFKDTSAMEIGGKVGLMEEKLVSPLHQQSEFKEVASQLVNQVSGAIQTLNANQLQQKEIAMGQQNQVTELIDQSKKLIAQCAESSRDLGNQKLAFLHQFTQMKQWQSNVEQELLTGQACRGDLANHAHGKVDGNQFIKEELHAAKVQNLNRVDSSSVRGQNHGAFGGVKEENGGGSGSDVPDQKKRVFI